MNCLLKNDTAKEKNAHSWSEYVRLNISLVQVYKVGFQQHFINQYQVWI